MLGRQAIVGRKQSGAGVVRQHLCETVAHPAVEGIAAAVEIQQDRLAIAVPWAIPPPVDPLRNGGGDVVDIKRRAVPDECFRDKGLMSKWIDGNR